MDYILSVMALVPFAAEVSIPDSHELINVSTRDPWKFQDDRNKEKWFCFLNPTPTYVFIYI